MIVSTMVFVVLGLLVGGLLGFVFGQARARVDYEKRLSVADANLAALQSGLANMTYFLRSAGLEQVPTPSATIDKERE